MLAAKHPIAEVSWESDATPVSTRFRDPYFAREDGRGETQHVFLAANGLPHRWLDRSVFTIAELGFGTGLNFFETLATWQANPTAHRILTFVSFELYPMAPDDMARALAPWPDFQPSLRAFLAQYPANLAPGKHTLTFAGATLELHIGDARDTVPSWEGRADAWYLDGFSPAKNPELWTADLMGAVYQHTSAAGGTFATYTAAGFVRRNLAAAGFKVQKIKGYGRKRESLSGQRGQHRAPHAAEQSDKQ